MIRAPVTATLGVSRRSFVKSVLVATAATAVFQGRVFLASRGWLAAAEASQPDLVHDTFNGLFVKIGVGIE